MNISWHPLLSALLLSYFSAISFSNAANAASPVGGDTGSGAIVNTTNGNAHWVEAVYPGNGPFALEMTLHHNSRNNLYSSSAGSVGRGWSHSYSSSIVHFLSGPSSIAIIEFATVLRADGKRYTFKPSAGAWVGKTDAPGRLGRTASGWTWTAMERSKPTTPAASC